MRILLTNDDGYDAEGLAVLQRIAGQLAGEVWTVAPEAEQSGASRALTLSMPVRVRQTDEKSFAVSGTPTDCIMLAVQEFMPEPPDLVLSGVNRGQNLGEDITFSGTVAGALQGMALHIPSIALSQVLANYHVDRIARFEVAETHAPGVIAALLKAGWPDRTILNINFPDVAPDEVAGVEVTVQGFRGADPRHFEKRTDLRGRDYYWMGYRGRGFETEDGSDLHAVAAGRISVTPLMIDLTDHATGHGLRRVLGGAVPRLHVAERA